MPKMAILERFRSRERDAQTDAERAAALKASVDAAIASARREADGLSHRVDQARQRAAFIDPGYQVEEAGLEPADERTMREMETTLVTCERRIAALEAQIARLDALGRSVDAIFAASE